MSYYLFFYRNGQIFYCLKKKKILNSYKFYIGKDFINNFSSEVNDLPVIRKSKLKIDFFLKGLEFEGPFDTIKELKLNSIIYKNIECSVKKYKILKEENIKDFDNIILFPFEHTYSPDFIYLFLHAWIGKLNENKVSGIHYKSKNVKIDNIINYNYKNYTYNAKFSVYNETRNKWMSINQVTTFFPDHWTVQKLFKELDIAYNNKVHFNGNVYYGFTTDNIKVKIIIDGNSAKTMYPVIN